MRFFNFLTNQPWAITESAAHRMLEIYYAALERKANGEEVDIEALEKELGRKVDNTRATTVRDGVATIPVHGPIFRRADVFTNVSNSATVDAIARDFNRQIDDPSVSGIIFDVDSPGGEVNGINELSNMIYAARSIKPIVAYIGGEGNSGAYWLASACSQIVVDATGTVGSIGVIAGVPDPTKENKRHIQFISSQSPNKRPDPTAEAGRGLFQSHVDELASVFVDTVARNRNVKPETVVKDFGAGWLLVGQNAVRAGLADRVGSYEQVLAELSGKSEKPSLGNGDSRMSDKKDANSSLLQRLKAALSGDEMQVLADPAPADDSVEIKALRAKAAQVDRYQEQIEAARTKEAEAFAGSLVLSKVLMPAKKEAVQTIYVQLAKDDAHTPLASGSRLDSFTAMFDGLPGHNLTSELTKTDLPPGSSVLNPDPTEKDQVEKDEKAIRAWGEKQNPKSTRAA